MYHNCKVYLNMFLVWYPLYFNLHIHESQVQNFGEPFFLVIHEMETLYDVKSRIQKKLEITDEEFLKVENTYRMT